VLAYQPVWYAGYVWDDNFHLTTNSCIVGPVGFQGIWTLHGDLRAFPLTITTFWFEHTGEAHEGWRFVSIASLAKRVS
jgi:hypothetical protein